MTPTNTELADVAHDALEQLVKRGNIQLDDALRGIVRFRARLNLLHARRDEIVKRLETGDVDADQDAWPKEGRTE